ncbi:hypothetical protein Q8F55_002431 [Vanrija albida]|uniref:Uncharacterized protein n=1 Tax=Vanrija albida TaxID=181172 RepID=A0ABR3Q9R9_9TREE
MLEIPVIGGMHRRRRARRRAHAAAVVTAIGSLLPSSSSTSASSSTPSPTEAPAPSSRSTSTSNGNSSTTTQPREFAYATYHGAGYDGTYGSALPRGRQAGPSTSPAYAEPASSSKAPYQPDEAAPPSYDDVVPRTHADPAACARDGHDAHKSDKGIVCRRCGEQV